MKSLAAGFDRVRPAPPGVVVLLYHRVGGASGLEVDLPVERFEAQMAALAASGRATTLDTALAALEAPSGAAVNAPVVVTFDDGTADFAEVALPVLVRHRVPALLYVATDFVERRRSFPDDGTPVSWASLADAASTGLVEIGSHTHTHALLDRAPAADIDMELDRSIELIGERLGTLPGHFAYPKALAGSAAAERAVRARFRSAALAGTRPNRYGHTDPYRLSRSPIQRADGMRFFEQKLAGGMAFEDTLRRAINRVRYAGATT
ncbi:MAG: Polysaccharide deacetylase [Actinomycetia bacterium]|nr:Polysaccharide deacetylase [Actinomycetes bacterium]